MYLKKFRTIFLVLILLAACFLRLYRFSNPIADWHSWRQSDTSAVSRNFVKYGFDLLHPRMNNISNVQSGLENPQGYFFAEFPLYNAVQAGLFVLFDHFTIEEWGRLITIFSSLCTTLFIYLLARRHANEMTALFAAGFYALLPYNIFYGRVILPDPSMVMAILGGIYFFDRYLEESSKPQLKVIYYVLYILSVIFIGVAFLLKPPALFFTLPLFYLAWRQFGKKMFIRLELLIFLIVSLVPLILWRWWESHYPEGVPAFLWLFNEGNIRFTGAFFYWLFAERISKLILGYWGIAIVLFGFLTKRKGIGFFLSFAASSLLYLGVIARGNVQHDYYQILIVPTLAFFFGLGADFLFERAQTPSTKISSYAILSIVSVFILAFGWYQVRDYFNINNPALVAAGKTVDELTPKNAKIIAPLDGDSSLLYQTNRQGWASFEKPLPELIKMGAGYLVLVNPKQQDYDIGKTYPIVTSTNQYILFKLQ